MKEIRDIKLSYTLSVEHKLALLEEGKWNPFTERGTDLYTSIHTLPFIYPEYPVKFLPEVDFFILEDNRWIAEPKYNGWRILIIHDRRGVTFWSRRGKQHKISAQVSIPEGCMLDCELIAENTSLTSHNKVNSYIRKCPDKLHFIVFDILYMDYKPVMHYPLWRRRDILLSLQLKDTLKIIETVPKDIQTFTELTRRGFEGIVLKCLDSQYEADGTNWVKVKSKEDLEYAWSLVSCTPKPS